MCDQTLKFVSEFSNWFRHLAFLRKQPKRKDAFMLRTHRQEDGDVCWKAKIRSRALYSFHRRSSLVREVVIENETYSQNVK